ncbi:MAG: hypothetical protein WA121_10560 [Syntrophales bacterium]
MANNPSIVNGPRLEVKEIKEYILPCPKCLKDMRITDIAVGAVIKCDDCQNITWRISYIPPWWAKTSRFVLSVLLAFILGLGSSLLATWLYEKYYKVGEVRSELNLPTATTKR